MFRHYSSLTAAVPRLACSVIEAALAAALVASAALSQTLPPARSPARIAAVALPAVAAATYVKQSGARQPCAPSDTKRL